MAVPGLCFPSSSEYSFPDLQVEHQSYQSQIKTTWAQVHLIIFGVPYIYLFGAPCWLTLPLTWRNTKYIEIELILNYFKVQFEASGQ